MLERGRQELGGFKVLAESLGVTQYAGVATEVFRRASNGAAFLKSVRDLHGLRLDLVSQTEEGRLGFLTALSTFPDAVDSGSVVAWDSGGGSFQMTTQKCCGARDGGPSASATSRNSLPPVSSLADMELNVYEGCWGSSSATAAMVDQVQGGCFKDNPSPNPCSVQDAEKLTEIITKDLHPPPTSLTGLLGRSETVVVGIGGETCAFRMAALACGTPALTLPLVQEAITKCTGKTDAQLAETFPEPQMVVPKLVLVAAVLRHVGIPSMCYRPTNGSCNGLLLHPRFWS
eukprot:m.208407 g.208407  ORF g.208407 m.208407 type:complete len:288 (+) comp18533_c0_seq3:392-1255(+)